jgi:ribonuclease-3
MATHDLRELEARLEHTFAELSLLDQAVTHASATTGTCTDNERLEFLGDAVVTLAVNDHLYRLFTRCEEGKLTEIKSWVVSAPSLARRSRALGLQEFARMGRGMPASGGLSDAVLANLFEAVVGALYLDAGFERAKEFVIAQLQEAIEGASLNRGEQNNKAALQKLAAVRFGELPRYRLVSQEGPDHDKVFEVLAVIGERSFSAARGRTKKEAEQRAAGKALDEIRAEDESGN